MAASVGFTESVVEEATLDWFGQIGYAIEHGPGIAPGEVGAERTDYHEVILGGRLRDALVRINLGASVEAIAEAVRLVTQGGGASLIQANRDMHLLVMNGVQVETTQDGEARGELIRLVDFDEPQNNDFVAVNQFTVVADPIERRPDVVVFVNGLPLAVIELKNAADESATVEKAWGQLQTYQAQIPRLFHFNTVMVASDGVKAILGGIGTPRERWGAWRTVEGDELARASENPLEVLIKGVFAPGRFLDLIESFVVFEDDGATIEKKVAQYHQFHAVRKAVGATLRAAAAGGNRRGGVIWHTQGSGKSLTMLFFAGKLILEPELADPTIVMLTDRIDLDGQLFGTFARGQHVLRQAPVQATSRAGLRDLLTTAGGGVVFTTIQKFFPEIRGDAFPLLSDRRNVVVLADEAHRSQYDTVDGYAAHIRDALPNATFVGFTGTPLELGDRDTTAIFGDYIDTYDMARAVEDGATVPIHYESRLINLVLPDGSETRLDEEFEDITEAEEAEGKAKLASKWTQLEALVGSGKRLGQVAEDLVAHFEARQEVIVGKGMVVCMSRRICVELYEAIIALRPGWHDGDDEAGRIKVIMTGSASDELAWQGHIRNKKRRERIGERFKDPNDPLELVIVRDMWLTGFDVPPMHTMYLDKPMKGHALMQAIARVNRVFRDKPGGLVVDYIGIANRLKEALRLYSERGGGERTEAAALDMDKLIWTMTEKLEVCRAMFAEFDYAVFLTGSHSERVQLLTQAEDFVFYKEARELRQVRERGDRFLARFQDAAAALLAAFAMAGATPQGRAVRAEVAFFQTVKAAVTKTTTPQAKAGGDVDHAVRQLIEAAIAPQGVVDIFAAAGLQKPDIGILSDGFLDEVRDMPQRNLALELLQKLLKDEIGAKERTSLVQAKLFSDRVKLSLTRYHNRAIETAQVIEELIALAKEMRADRERGDELGLTEEELAFYDALEVNDSAVRVLGDEQLKAIARELAETVRRNATIDWTVRENVRANLRRMVRRVLRTYGYPPDRQERATQTVVQQAELLGREWAA